MKSRFPHTSLILVVFTLGALISGEALAHNIKGSLRESRKATAAWETTCGAGTAKIVYRVSQRKSTPFLVQLTTSKDGASNTVTAPGGKDKFSPYGELAQGEGKYTLTLSKKAKKKSTLGQVIYNVESHCELASSKHSDQTVPERKR
jgi:hypothetical protein